MGKLNGAVGELRATVHVKRAATGKVETYELVGSVNAEQEAALLRPKQHHGSIGAVVAEGAKLSNER